MFAFKIYIVINIIWAINDDNFILILARKIKKLSIYYQLGDISKIQIHITDSMEKQRNNEHEHEHRKQNDQSEK